MGTKTNRGSKPPLPIEEWVGALLAQSGGEALPRLKRAYEVQWPKQAEIVFTGHCAFACQHCIYPPTYSRDNGVLSSDRWIESLVRLEKRMDLKTFVYSGRSMPVDGAELLISLRRHLPAARIGAIDNGISIRPHTSRLKEARLDWIDISVDGMEREHDLQRGRAGSFRDAVEGLAELRHQELAPRLNILTCLTTLNEDSVTRMIRTLNRDGYRSFFVTPVVIVPYARPQANLKPSAEKFLRFVHELRSLMGGLDDAYVEVGLFDAEWPVALLGAGERLAPHEDHLLQYSTSGSSELRICYYPGSLVGARELVLNSDGDRLYPKAMAHGRIPSTLRRANLLRSNLQEDHRRLVDELDRTPFVNELRRERSILRGPMERSSLWATSILAPVAAASL